MAPFPDHSKTPKEGLLAALRHQDRHRALNPPKKVSDLFESTLEKSIIPEHLRNAAKAQNTLGYAHTVRLGQAFFHLQTSFSVARLTETEINPGIRGA